MVNVVNFDEIRIFHIVFVPLMFSDACLYKNKWEFNKKKTILVLIVLSSWLTTSCRDERDFGLETETETRVVSRPVSSFETTCQKSQYQSQNLRLISKVSVSVSNFETTMQKSQSQSQNAMDGLAHHRF